MTTLVHCNVPATDFALAETFQTVPEMNVVCEQLAACPNGDPLPLLWVKTSDRAAVETALAADPTVAAYAHRGESGPAHRYRIEWTPSVQFVVTLLTQADGIIRDAAGGSDGWQVRVVYPDREALRTAHELCHEYNISLDVRTIRHADGETDAIRGPEGQLTPEQHEAISYAYNQGYFEVPRTVTLEELATELDISHQALSERLRRAHHRLIETALTMPLADTIAGQQRQLSEAD